MEKYKSILWVLLLVCCEFFALPLQSLGHLPQESPTGWNEKQEYTDRDISDNATTTKASEEQGISSLFHGKQYLQFSKDDSNFVRYVKANLSNPTLKHRLFFLLYLLSPFIILLVGISMFIFKRFNKIQIVCLNLAEIAYVIGHIEIHKSISPWFCSPDIVGWIVTIIACVCTLAILYMHWILVKQFIRELSETLYSKSFWFYLLFSAISICIPITLTLKENGLYYLAFSAIIILILLWKTRDDIGYASKSICTVGLYSIGFFCFFLNLIGFLITIYLVVLVLNEWVKPSRKSSSNYDSDSYDTGTLYHDFSGNAYVRHDDGSRTDLREDGYDLVDSEGRIWGRTDDNDGTGISC